MSVYITKSSVNFGGTIVPAGTKVSLDQYDEAFVSRLIEKGSVVEVTEDVVDEPTTVPEAPQTTDTPTPPQVTSDPTPEQIEQDLKEAGV